MTTDQIYDYIQGLLPCEAIRVAEVIQNNSVVVSSLHTSIMAKFLTGYYDNDPVSEWIDPYYVRWSTYRRTLLRELALTGAAIDK